MNSKNKMTAEEFTDLLEDESAFVLDETTDFNYKGMASGFTVLRRKDGTMWRVYWAKQGRDYNSIYDGPLEDSEVHEVVERQKITVEYIKAEE